MKIKKLVAGIVAAAMAVSTAIVAPMTVSAVETVDITAEMTGTGISPTDLEAYSSLTVTYTPTLASSCSHPGSHSTETYCPWAKAIFIGDVTSTEEDFAVYDGSGNLTGYSTNTNWYQPANPATAGQYVDAASCTATISIDDILASFTADANWQDRYTLNYVKISAWDGTVTKVEGNVPSEGDPEPYTVTYDGSTVNLTVEKNQWGEGNVCQHTVNIVPTGVSLGSTTFAELKGLYSGIEYADWAIDNVSANADVSKISTCIFMQHTSSYSWFSVDGTSVDFAGVTSIQDDSPIMAIGFQINYNLSDSDLVIGDELYINGVPVTSVTLSEGELDLVVGDEETLTATVLPNDATLPDVTWASSDENIVTVEDGVVTAVAEGEATITATADGKSDTCVVTVSPATVAVTGISLDKDTLALTVGGATGTLTATVTPDNATDKTVTWTSSDEDVATVVDGVVTAVASGPATITAKAGEFTDTCEVTVTNPVTAISIDETAGVVVGDTKTLTVITTPTDPDAYTIVWSSDDTSVATVADGVITGVKAGTANITATVYGTNISDTCAVTVTSSTVAVTGVTLDKATLDLVKGETVALSAKVAPADATNTDVVWASSKPAVATVDANGKVTAVATGETIITVTTDDGGYEATCTVTVTNPVTSITLDKTSGEMTEGDTLTLNATVNPTDADDATVTWTSSDTKVATVKDGVVTAVAEGKATITAKAGDKTATCEITVKAAVVEVTKIEIDADNIYMSVGDSITLTATVTPDNATDKTVTWTSSGSAVTVDANGKITAVAEGTATITAKAGECTDTCEVTVEVEPIGHYLYSYDGSPIELTLEVPSWDTTRLHGSKDIAFVPTGATMQKTTFAQLKQLCSGISIRDWEVNTITEGADPSKASVAIFIKTGSNWQWHAYYSSSVNFADITDIADTDVIMEIGWQINYDATGSDFKAGDVIVINGMQGELEDGTYTDGKWEELSESDIPELLYGEANVGLNFVETANARSATYSDGKLYIYLKVEEETIANAESASIVIRYKDGKALRLTTSCAYKALTSDVKAEEGYLFLAFVIDGVSDVESNALYYGNFAWCDITLN